MNSRFIARLRELIRLGSQQGNARTRMIMLIGGFVLVFTLLAARLVDLSIIPESGQDLRTGASVSAARPDVVDRNGVLLATDIEAASLHADSRKVIDAEESIEAIAKVLPDLDRRRLLAKLKKRKGFVWIRRELTPRQEASLRRLGLPGFVFTKEKRRVYPNGRLAAHVLGHVNVDNEGRGGIEKYIDEAGISSAARRLSDAPARVRLSIDARAQHALTETLAQAQEEFQAIAAMGAIVHVATGEVVAMASLPDYSPNEPKDALKPDRLNRMSAGVYEPGSTMKMLTVAMALDEGVATLESRFDAREPLKVGRHTINDYHAQRRILTLQEVFTHSSNIGAAKMAAAVGLERHRAFLEKFDLLKRQRIELPESGVPLSPRTWKELHSMTIAFGHGVSVTPLQLLAAGTALVNGGRLVPPTFLPRGEMEALALSRQVVSAKTSDVLRQLMAINVEKGTARKAQVKGYRIGGKTGTAEKVIKGRYSKKHRRTSFLGAFPIDRPQYALIVTLDEPKPTEKTHGFATSGWNAVPTAGKVIARVAPILGVLPTHAAPAEAETAALAPAE